MNRETPGKNRRGTGNEPPYDSGSPRFPLRGPAAMLLCLVLVGGAGCAPQTDSAKPPKKVPFPAQAQNTGPSEEDLLKERFSASREEILGHIRDALKAKHYEEAFKVAEPFVVTGDEELVSLSEDAEKKILTATVKKLPAGEIMENHRVYSRLAELEPGNNKYQQKKAHYAKKAKALEKKLNSTLELVTWKAERQRYYYVVEATVRNLTAAPAADLRAVIEYLQSNGVRLKKHEIPLEPNPLPPGATTKVETKVLLNPLMYSVNIDFVNAMGTPVPWYREDAN